MAKLEGIDEVQGLCRRALEMSLPVSRSPGPIENRSMFCRFEPRFFRKDQPLPANCEAGQIACLLHQQVAVQSWADASIDQFDVFALHAEMAASVPDVEGASIGCLPPELRGTTATALDRNEIDVERLEVGPAEEHRILNDVVEL